MGMGISHWEWEGFGLKKIFPLISRQGPVVAYFAAMISDVIGRGQKLKSACVCVCVCV